MKKFLPVLLLTVSLASAQPVIVWENTIGGWWEDHLTSTHKTRDKGFIIGGHSDSDIGGDKTETYIGGGQNKDYWIIKVDSVGNIQWQNTIGGSSFENLGSVEQTEDGGYIAGGISGSQAGGDKTENRLGPAGTYDYWVVKLDSTGNIQWENTIGGSLFDRLYTTKQTMDGGYILGGYSTSSISGDKTENAQDEDFWVIKLDSAGNIQWQNTIGGSGEDIMFTSTLIETKNGEYIIGGYSLSDISGDKHENNIGDGDYWVVKLNTSGNIEWENTIGGNGLEIFNVLQQTTDEGYILGGYSFSNISGDKTENSKGWEDYWIVKLDSLGNVEWDKTIGGDSTDALSALQQTADGGYLLGGSSNSGISGDKTEGNLVDFDGWFVKLDAAGNIQWQETIGGTGVLGTGADEVSSITEISEGEFLFGMTSNSNISADKTENSFNYSNDYWIIKMRLCSGVSAGSITGTDTVDVQQNASYSVSQTTGYNYNWSATNGVVTSGQGTNIVFITWNSAAQGAVQVVVSELSCVDTATFAVVILGVGNCSAAYALYPDTVPHHYYVVDSASGTLPLTYTWSWGDGSSDDTSHYPSHTYSGAGTYTICLTITDADGCTDTYCNPHNLLKSENAMIYIDVVAELPSGIHDNLLTNISLYPNPTNNTLTITAPAINAQATLILFDALGKEVLNQTAQPQELGKGVVLDVQELNGGVYFLSIRTAAGSRVMKVVKN